jgi:tetratricopeptide (TPR) repeat protein
VSDASEKAPLLDAFYQYYLADETSAHYVAEVSKHYTLGTLARLAAYGSRSTRRAAVLAIGFLGSFESNELLGRALHDEDRVVRLLAENSIRELWYRDGSVRQQHHLQYIIRLNNALRFEQAAREASDLIQDADGFAEAWNQRAIAYYQCERYSESVRDCRQALKRNPYHFAAAVGMGHCYLEMFDALAALECFRWALQINPDMENVRAQVGYLQRTLEES